MKVLDLFSGIGGFSLGLQRAGMETVAFCEIDPFCRKVLHKHWPRAPIHDDIRTLQGTEFGPIDVICGGFPCQPFSLAGKQKGKNDDRHLWPEMLRVIAQARPTWVIAENVTGIIGMVLDDVLTDLENEGYTSRTLNIPACGVDAPHRRERIWIIAHSNKGLRGQGSAEQPERQDVNRVCEGSISDTNCELIRNQSGRGPGSERKSSPELGNNGQTQPLADPNCGKRKPGPKHSRRETRRNISQRDIKAGSLANTDSKRESQSEGIKQQSRRRTSNGSKQPRAEWPTEPGVGRVVNGLPGRVDRIKGLGNAVVPQIPEIIGRAIMEN